MTTTTRQALGKSRGRKLVRESSTLGAWAFVHTCEHMCAHMCTVAASETKEDVHSHQISGFVCADVDAEISKGNSVN